MKNNGRATKAWVEWLSEGLKQRMITPEDARVLALERGFDAEFVDKAIYAIVEV